MTLLHNPAKTGQAFSIQTDANDRPVALIGRVNPVGTAGRGAPPAPHSGFVTDKTAFDRGHIMALELDGPDISQNIVPQYSMWQRGGNWRRMEEAILAATYAKGAIMVVELSYTSHPDVYDSQKKRYQEMEIFDWQDKRIPDCFDIWLIKPTDAEATEIEKDLLQDPKATEAEFLACLAKARKLAKYKSFDHSRMPPEDVAYREDLQIRSANYTAFENYKEQREMDLEEQREELKLNPPQDKSGDTPKKLLTPKQEREVMDVTRSPLRSDIEFASTQGQQVKDVLKAKFDWPEQKTKALNGGRVVAAVFGAPKVREQNAQKQRHDDYEEEYEKKKKVKEKHQGTGVTFPPKSYSGTAPY